MATCPNKNLDSWKKLSSVHGESTALYLWDKYNGEIPDRYMKSLEQTLVDGFLKDFGITITDYEDLKKDLNIDGVTASDFITKSIIRNKGESILPEVAYFAYSMLGKENDKVRSNLRYLVGKWEKYNERFTHHANILKRKRIYIKDKVEYKRKIKDLVIVDFLRDTLEMYYNNPVEFEKQLDRKWTKEDFTLWQKFIDWLENTIASFSSSVLTDAKKRDLLENIGLSIADEVLNRNYEYFNYEISQDSFRKYYNRTIESDPIAKKIVEKGQAAKMVLTGSLALRRAGSVYRPVSESIHDIDWVIPYYLVSEGQDAYVTNRIMKNIPSKYQNEDIDKLKINQESKNVLLHMMHYKWFNQFVDSFPSFRFIGGFFGKEHLANKESFTAQGVIDGQFYTEDGYHMHEYSFYQKDPVTKRPTKVTRTERVKHKKGEYIEGSGYVIDFFVRLTPLQEEHENYFKLWKEIMIAKLKMGRSKDYADWKVFVPYIKSNDRFNFYYEGFRHFNEESNPVDTYEDSAATVVKAYQGINGRFVDDRQINYYTLDINEAKDYGQVREVLVDTEDFIKTNSPEFKNLESKFRNSTGITFDILNNSPEGLENQNKFFNYLIENGYEGLDMTGYSDSKYLVKFSNTSKEEEDQSMYRNDEYNYDNPFKC